MYERLSSVMLRYSRAKVCGVADVALLRIRQALKEVGVEHNGLPAVAWNPHQKQAPTIALGFKAKAGGDEECCPLCLSHVKRALC